MQAAFPMVPLSIRAWIITTVSFSGTCNSLEANSRDAESRNVCIEDCSRDLNGWIFLADFRTIFPREGRGSRIGSQNGKKIRLFVYYRFMLQLSLELQPPSPRRGPVTAGVPPSFQHYREPLTTAMLVFRRPLPRDRLYLGDNYSLFEVT